MEDNTCENKKIDHLKRIIDNLNQHWHSIQLLLSHVSKPLLVDDRELSTVFFNIKKTFNKFFIKMDEIRLSLETIDISVTLSEIKYIGNRLKNIEKDIREIKNNNIRKNIHLDITLDGQKMVSKSMENNIDPLKEVLDTLTERERNSLIHRYGLFGQSKKTLILVGKCLGVGSEQARKIINQSLRKLRHASRRNLMEKVLHNEIRKEVFD